MAKENKSPVSKKVEDIKPEDKRKALETALTQIKKQFGEGAVMRLGQNNGMHVDAISTGSLSLDLALGIGGLPRGRIIEIYGPESSGKTTLALHCVAEGQKMGGNAAFIDVEHALDPGLCVRARRRRGFSARFAAGYRRTGARDHRGARALRRHRCYRCGLRGGARARARRSRAKWATAMSACRRV